MRDSLQMGLVIVGVLAASVARVYAQPAPDDPTRPAAPAPAPAPAPAAPAPAPAPADAPAIRSTPAPVAASPSSPSSPDLHPSTLHVHGFIGEGGFLSTANDYIGTSARGSLQLFEAGVNVSTELGDRLRAGFQLYGRDVGTFRDLPPRLDWAFIDYRWQPWLGLRAGVIKMPFGLYNEYADIDSARLSILMPQSVYSLRNRSALLSQTGFALYGERALGSPGSVEYQAWLGTLDVPSNALVLSGGTLDNVDTKYVTGVQVFWRPPVDGLRVGASVLQASIDFHVTLDPTSVAALVAAGLVGADFDPHIVVSQRPSRLWIASAEYLHDDWLVAAEYARSSTHQQTTIPTLIPTTDDTSERFYVMLTHRLSHYFEAGAYYSVLYANVDDRQGHSFPDKFDAWQRDATATVRFDVNDHWLWKVEAHLVDGVADLDLTTNPHPERYWGLFLFKTTVTF
ncbi:MAG: hypothetical protein ABI591_24475 [Kofleriaceae bacterium]